MEIEGRFPDLWLSTPLGRCFLRSERRLVRQALEQRFGVDMVQIGAWGDPRGFLRGARTQRRTLLDWRPGRGQDVTSEPDALALATDAADIILLPHTLELVQSPHSLLREVDRVLRPDGHLLVLGFNGGSLWGLRQLLSISGFPAGTRRVFREGRLRDWLELLSFEIGSTKRYGGYLPISAARLGVTDHNPLVRWLPPLAGGFLMGAQKRTQPLTPMRQRWRRPRLQVVGGLTEPTTRAGRINPSQ